jgi:hypothetical protein
MCGLLFEILDVKGDDILDERWIESSAEAS